ncbi:MAG: WXG100 family type VII secretion target [Actinomycetota bacterium]|nr:WXG100 family type VII secretion target [Actinomycetota bacterium]
MTDNILLRADDARAVAGDVNRAAAETTDQLASLRGCLATLGDSFQGQSARAFDDRYQEWAERAWQLIDALDALGGFLDGAAGAIEETDARLAAQLRA